MAPFIYIGWVKAIYMGVLTIMMGAKLLQNGHFTIIVKWLVVFR